VSEKSVSATILRWAAALVVWLAAAPAVGWVSFLWAHAIGGILGAGFTYLLSCAVFACLIQAVLFGPPRLNSKRDRGWLIGIGVLLFLSLGPLSVAMLLIYLNAIGDSI
jgi:hypothetical protein